MISQWSELNTNLGNHDFQTLIDLIALNEKDNSVHLDAF